MKHTNKDTLAKGVKYLAGALPLIFIGPSILYSAFNNQDKALYWPILIIGILMSFGAIFLIFKGIMTLLKALFDE
ncbi:DUF6095 family protein [Psychroflexus lacisalsi]|jgi:hypothetical protein|uniref:DUF6095 family protein n=1 Tax=Psychroflexus lacisalsi TaxID=503928 RepID=A0ABN1KCW0_9FLAO|nr:DUF6095 family protein [Psychroflexus lacisalsi]MBZ9620060.1 DUF6095 family protein [Psychroflexus lacisalsi]